MSEYKICKKCEVSFIKILNFYKNGDCYMTTCKKCHNLTRKNYINTSNYKNKGTIFSRLNPNIYTKIKVQLALKISVKQIYENIKNDCKDLQYATLCSWVRGNKFV